MSTSPVMVVTNFFGAHINAANVGVGFNNPDGTANVTGTVIGLGQTAHSAVDFARSGITTVGKAMPGNQMRGLAGNDTLQGGEGNDVYYFNAGDGQDVAQLHSEYSRELQETLSAVNENWRLAA